MPILYHINHVFFTHNIILCGCIFFTGFINMRQLYKNSGKTKGKSIYIIILIFYAYF
jgi:hypothetical protein